jgi:hypothetical protein
VKEAIDCFLGGEEAVAASWKRRRLRVRKVAKKSKVNCSYDSTQPSFKRLTFPAIGNKHPKVETELMHLRASQRKGGQGD